MRIACLLVLNLIGIGSYANVLEVCNNCQYETIEAAYQASFECDTILIKNDAFQIDNWVIEKSLTIIGENGAHLISKEGGEIITINSDHVSIIGLKLSGVTTNYLKENAAIRVRGSKYFLLENNKIVNCFFAIYLEKAKKGMITNNLINGDASTEAESGNGVHAWHCDDLIISNNEVLNHRDGIYLEFVNNSDVLSNHSHHNKRYGLHYMFSNDDTYISNIIEKNGVGVAVMFSRRIIMKHNTFANNWGHAAYGLLLKEIYDAEITDNNFLENTIGIFVEGSNRINYLNNNFRRNGWAIKFSGGCEANVISNNNFLYNSIDLVVASKLNDNKFENNYWSDYTGYDLDKNGIGDVPYYPVKLFSYIHQQAPESVVLMRSLFVEIINYAEKVSPVFTPKDIMDSKPQMNIIL